MCRQFPGKSLVQDGGLAALKAFERGFGLFPSFVQLGKEGLDTLDDALLFLKRREGDGVETHKIHINTLLSYRSIICTYAFLDKIWI